MPRIHPFLFAAVVLVAPAGSPAGAQPTQALVAGPLTVAAPALPSALGTFALRETSIQADPLLGTYYRYGLGARRVHAVVFVQPALSRDGTPLSADSVVAGAIRSFKGLPRTTPGGYARFQVTRDAADTLSVGARRVAGHVVAAITSRGAVEAVRETYVYPLGSRYVRVLIDVDGTPAEGGTPDGAAERARIDEFVRAAVRAVAAAWRLE